MKAVGARLPRYDGIEHVTGRTIYVDDVRVPGTLWAKALRSPLHSAAITRPRHVEGRGDARRPRGRSRHGTCRCSSTGTSSALGIPADEPLLAKDEVRYKGQPIARRRGRGRGDGAWRPSTRSRSRSRSATPLFDIREAFDADAPKIHQWGNWYPHFEGEMDRRQIRKGDDRATRSTRPT